MPRVVLDTNVVVSGLLKPGGKPELILMLIFDEELRICELCLSDDVFSEYEKVLGYGKFKGVLDQNRIKRFLSHLKKQASWVTPRVPVKALSDDPSDNRFLACAIEAGADFFITGNIKHFPFKKLHKTRIVTPAEFLDIIAETLFA